MLKLCQLAVIALLLAGCAVPQEADPATSANQAFSRCHFPDLANIANNRPKSKLQAAAYLRCANAETRRWGLQLAKSICFSKGMRDKTPDMAHCQLNEARARCIRSVGEYQSSTMQMNIHAPNYGSAEDYCWQVYTEVQKP